MIVTFYEKGSRTIYVNGVRFGRPFQTTIIYITLVVSKKWDYGI